MTASRTDPFAYVTRPAARAELERVSVLICGDGHNPALATGVCVRCGADLFGYYVDTEDRT